MEPYITKELKKVFPNKELRAIPSDHEIFNSAFEFPKGLPTMVTTKLPLERTPLSLCCHCRVSKTRRKLSMKETYSRASVDSTSSKLRSLNLKIFQSTHPSSCTAHPKNRSPSLHPTLSMQQWPPHVLSSSSSPESKPENLALTRPQERKQWTRRGGERPTL